MEFMTTEQLEDAHRTIINGLAALKAKPSGVVLPPHCTDRAIPVKYRKGWNCCISEVARLNQPASAGDDRKTIRAVFLRNGFTIKEGQADLKPYVYAAADELMSIARAALSAPSHGEQGPEGLGITQEQIDRHTTTAWECPPQSLVVLVSSLRRLASKNAAPSAGSQKEQG